MDERCLEALNEMQTFLDGECGKSLEEAVRQHLDDCPPCLDRAEFERHIRLIVARTCKDAAPSGLMNRITEHVRSMHPSLGGEQTA